MSDDDVSTTETTEKTIIFALVRAFVAFISKFASTTTSGSSLASTLSMLTTSITLNHPLCALIKFVLQQYQTTAPEMELDYNLIISQRFADQNELAQIERDSYLQSFQTWNRLYLEEQEAIANQRMNEETAAASAAAANPPAASTPAPRTTTSRSANRHADDSENMHDIDAISFDNVDEAVISHEERNRFIDTLKQDQLFLSSGQLKTPDSTSAQYKGLFPKK
jgi:hypothetical protein